MKKLLLLLLIAFSSMSCAAQQFEDVEPVKENPRLVTGTVKHSSESGSLIVGSRLSFQLDVKLQLDWEYHVVVSYQKGVDIDKVIPATVIDFRITENQARDNILQMIKETGVKTPAVN